MCLLILRSLSAMLRGLKRATICPRRPRKAEFMRGNWNMKEDYDEVEDEAIVDILMNEENKSQFN